MPSSSRRSVLRASATVCSISLPGCAALSRVDPPTLGTLFLRNHHSEPHVVHVELTLDGRSVYRESERLPSASDQGPSSAVLQNHPTDAAPYVFRVWRDDQGRADGERVAIAENDSECLSLLTEVGSPWSDTASLAVLATGNPDYCERTPTES